MSATDNYSPTPFRDLAETLAAIEEFRAALAVVDARDLAGHRAGEGED